MIRTCNKAALYARFSSDNQRTESIDAQLRAMQDYCRQHGYSVVNTYVDEAKSATSDRRPSFQQMISDSANHTFNILLVHKLDRFARNRYDSAIYKRELKKNGVSVYSVLENLDNSPESIMMESVLEGMNEYYSQNLAREVMKGMKENALQCKHTGGMPPLGYDVDPHTKRLVINDAEAPIVKMIFSMFADGEGYSAILQKLHEHGYQTKRGGEFGKNSLHSILTNCKYKGLYTYNRSVAKSPDGTRNTHHSKPADEIISIQGGCPQIVETTVFEKVQQRIAENLHTGARHNAKTNYLLSGKVYCRECGKAMVGNTRRCGRNKDLYVTYRCMTKSYSCSNKEINRDYLEAYVVRLLETNIFNVPAIKSIAKKIRMQQETGSAQAQKKRQEICDQLGKTSAALKRVADAVADGLLSSTLIERLNSLEEEKSRLETELSQVNSAGNTEAAIIDPHLIPAEYARLRRSPVSPAFRLFVQSFIDRICVGRYSVTITLKTGLDIFDTLNTTYVVRRQDIYAEKKAAT